MSKARAKPAPAPEPEAELQSTVAALTERCDHLAQQLQVQNDILEEIRQELQYLVTNGVEIREPIGRLHPIPVLKGMALDPAGDDWGEKLVINHGHLSAEPNAVTKHSQDSSHCVEPTPAAEPHRPQSLTTAKAERPRDRLF